MAIKKVGPNRYRVSVSVRDKNKGYPITKQATVNGTLAAAKQAEADMLRQLKARSLTSAFASTFSEAIDLYVQKLRERGRASKPYAASIELMRRELGHVRLEEFPARFEAYRTQLMASPTCRGKPRKSASVNRHTAIVKAVFNRLVDLELIERNPISKIRFPKMEEQPRARRLTPEERLRLFAAIRERYPYIMPIVQYMIQVPCRVSELTTAKREQYSPFTQTVYIPDSKAGIPIHKPIPPDMVDYFRSLPADCPWLFFVKMGAGYRPLTNANLRYAWEACLARAGIKDFHVHDLRHEAATALYEAGNSERVIREIAGWKTNMLETYHHKGGLRSAQGVVWASRSADVASINVAAV